MLLGQNAADRLTTVETNCPIPKTVQREREWLNYAGSRIGASRLLFNKGVEPIQPPVIFHFILPIDFLKGCTTFVAIFKKGSSESSVPHKGTPPARFRDKAKS